MEQENLELKIKKAIIEAEYNVSMSHHLRKIADKFFNFPEVYLVNKNGRWIRLKKETTDENLLLFQDHISTLVKAYKECEEYHRIDSVQFIRVFTHIENRGCFTLHLMAVQIKYTHEGDPYRFEKIYEI
jgi:hypothetical protein